MWYEPFATEIQGAYLVGRQKYYGNGQHLQHMLYYESETELDIKRLNDALNRVLERQLMLRTILMIQECKSSAF